MIIEARPTPEALELDLLGEWRALNLPEIEAGLGAFEREPAPRVLIATERLTALDLTGSWRLRQFLDRLRKAGTHVEFRGAPPDQLRLIEATLQGGTQEHPQQLAEQAAIGPPSKHALHVPPLRMVGRSAVRLGADLLGASAFLGHVCVTAARAAGRFRRLRPVAIARHVHDTGITAIPIVTLIAFLISVIIAYMSAQQLRKYGGEIFVVDLVTIGVLRELAVLLTAIIVAGRSGSAFAAEIGSMRLNEEVDALYATGVDPFEVLVLPRVVGLVIALPLLTVIADLIGLVGGAVLCRFLLEMPLDMYVRRVSLAISPTTFWVGLVKAPVFAFLIALAGCQRGMQVRGSSRELGRLTTVAVVQAIFLVILADALFAVLFMEMDV